MWTLIVFVFLNSDAAAGGASTAISNYQFKTYEGCDRAAKAVTETKIGEGNYAHWTIIGKCIQINW
jgi:hypothetical protein